MQKEKQEALVSILAMKIIKQKGGEAEFGTYKHLHLFLDNMMFENYHYITDFNGTKIGKTIELLFGKAINSDPGVKIGNTEMVRPCVHFNALHLVRHAQGNFILSGMILRMIFLRFCRMVYYRDLAIESVLTMI